MLLQALLDAVCKVAGGMIDLCLCRVLNGAGPFEEGGDFVGYLGPGGPFPVKTSCGDISWRVEVDTVYDWEAVRVGVVVMLRIGGWQGW